MPSPIVVGAVKQNATFEGGVFLFAHAEGLTIWVYQGNADLFSVFSVSRLGQDAPT